MKLGINKVCVFVAFIILQVHDFIPHHHPHEAISPAILVDHKEDHHHHHFPVSNHHIDEFFFTKFFQGQTGMVAALVPGFNSFLNNAASQISTKVFEAGNLKDHPPRPPFLTEVSFRGPPIG